MFTHKSSLHRRSPYLCISLSLIALSLILSGCSIADIQSRLNSSNKALTDVTVQIDGSAVPYYAPLYMSKERGFFEEEGLNVQFTYAEGSTALQNVAAGNVDFGFPNADTVIKAKGRGINVSVVHTTYQQGIGAVLFNAETSKISSPADLKGKRIAVTDLGSPNYLQLVAILKSADLTPEDVDLVTVGSGAIVSALQNGDVDAIAFSRLRYFALESAGFPVGQILSDDYLPSFGNVLIARTGIVSEQPDLVKKFVTAFDKGIQYSISHPRQALEQTIHSYAPAFAGQEESILRVFQNLFIPYLWQSPGTSKYGLGYGNLTRWQKTIDAQHENGLIPSSFPAKDLIMTLERGDK